MHQAPKICIFTILACLNSAIIILVSSYNYWMYACKVTMTTYYAGFRNYPFLVKLYAFITKDSWWSQMISFSPLSIMLLEHSDNVRVDYHVSIISLWVLAHLRHYYFMLHVDVLFRMTRAVQCSASGSGWAKLCHKGLLLYIFMYNPGKCFVLLHEMQIPLLMHSYLEKNLNMQRHPIHNLNKD